MNKRSVLLVVGALVIAALVVCFAFWPRESARVAPTNTLRHFGATSTNLSVSTGATDQCPLGWWKKDVNTSICSTGWPWTPVATDAATTVFPIGNLALADFQFVTVYIHAQIPNAQDFTGEAWWRLKWGVKVNADSGNFQDPAGAEAGTGVDSQVGSQLSGCAPTLVQQGNQLGVQMLCGSTIAVEGAVDLDRSSLAPWVLRVSPTQVYDLTNVPVKLTITTTPGGAQYVNGGTANGYNLTQCSQVDDHTATCMLSAGTYAPGVGSICITSQAQPFCLLGGFTFDASGPDSAVPDSGADAADASDGGDAGPPPTVSLVTPNLGFATGGSSVVITGTGFVTGAVASINGNDCTSTTFTNSTSVTCAGTPAAVLTGTGATNEAVKVTNPGGPNGTGSGKIASFHYLSANVTPLALHWSTVGIHIATGISQIDDQIGLNNLAQATGGSQPPAPSGSFNGVASLPFSVFNGSSHSLAANPLSTSITSGLATVCTVGSMVVSTGVQVTSSLNAVSTTFIWAGTASNAWDFTTNSPGITFGSTDTSPHVWCYLANGTTTSQASVDNTVTTGNLTGTGTLTFFTLGALGNAGPRAWANFNWVGDMVWNGAVATSDQTNDRALLLAVSSP